MTERLHFHFSLSCIGEENGNPLQCSCLENSRDGGAWWVAAYGVSQSRTQLKWLSSSSSSSSLYMLIQNSSLPIFPLDIPKFVFYVCESLLLTSFFYNFFISVWYYVCLSLISRSMIISMCIHAATDTINSFFFIAKCTLPYLYLFTCQWTFRLLSCLVYCKQCCYEHWSPCIFLI